MSSGTRSLFRRRTSFLLATLGRRTESTWTAFLRDRSLSNAEFSALAVLASESPGQGQLASYLAIDPRNAGALVRKLEQRGWAEATSHPEDARRRVISMTSRGRAAWQAVQADLSEARRGYFDALDADEQHELERLLNKLNDAHMGSDQPQPPSARE